MFVIVNTIYPIIIFGNQTTILGKITIRISVIIFATKKGAAPLNIFAILRPVIIEQTFKQFPTGGVHAPTARPITKTTPNKIGEIPISIMLGKKTGVNNRIAGLTSINVPAINIIIINKNNILVGLRPKLDIISDSPSGILS